MKKNRARRRAPERWLLAESADVKSPLAGTQHMHAYLPRTCLRAALQKGTSEVERARSFLSGFLSTVRVEPEETCRNVAPANRSRHMHAAGYVASAMLNAAFVPQ